MSSKMRTCENCSEAIILDADDISFFELIKVPFPRRCHRCLMIQRLAFRNERTLYKRKCDFPGHSEAIISNNAPESKWQVYDQTAWRSDGWDPMEAGQDYDFSKPFFEQLKVLAMKVPLASLFNLNAVNSDYCNFTTNNKNCYLVFGGDFNENCSYSTFNFHSKDTLDTYFVEKCELCWELIDSEACYRTRFGQYAENCTDCAFIFDCVGCSNCVGCVGLRNKSYCIFNKQYSKEDYRQEIEKLSLNTRQGLAAVAARFEDLRKSRPHRYAHIFKSSNSTGDNILNANNVKDCFDINGPAENLHHFLLGGWDLKDSRYASHAGHGSELLYNSIAVASGCSRVLCSLIIISSQNVYYSWNCRASSNLFGCVGLSNKKYCIFNKQYSKEEYEEVLPKILEHMNVMPYMLNGKAYTYGDFFPPDLSPHGYNETVAQEYFPLAKEKALAMGFSWSDDVNKDHKTTLKSEDLPDSIKEVSDSILNEVLTCLHAENCNHKCTKAFRFTSAELAFYRRLDLPLPQLCPNCRHYMRVAKRNDLQTWRRACECRGTFSRENIYENTASHFHGPEVCPNEFETPYAPDRPEIIYCEQCYNSEVV